MVDRIDRYRNFKGRAEQIWLVEFQYSIHRPELFARALFT